TLGTPPAGGGHELVVMSAVLRARRDGVPHDGPHQNHRHDMTTAIRIHGNAQSTYVRSVLLALREKTLPHELVTIGAREQRQPAHLARHPFGRVPAMEHAGFHLYETQAILRYVD